MQRFDVSCKHLLLSYPEHVLSLLRLPGRVVCRDHLTQEVAAPPQLADAVLLVRWNGVDHLLHLEFETRADQLLIYVLAQGDETVVLEFAPVGTAGQGSSPFEPRQLEFDTSGFVQMEMTGLDTGEDE